MNIFHNLSFYDLNTTFYTFFSRTTNFPSHRSFHVHFLQVSQHRFHPDCQSSKHVYARMYMYVQERLKFVGPKKNLSSKTKLHAHALSNEFRSFSIQLPKAFSLTPPLPARAEKDAQALSLPKKGRRLALAPARPK